MSKIKNFFDKHPGVNKVFQTSDGFLFRREDQADAHASTLKNRKVKPHNRVVSDVISEKKEELDVTIGGEPVQGVKNIQYGKPKEAESKTKEVEEKQAAEKSKEADHIEDALLRTLNSGAEEEKPEETPAPDPAPEKAAPKKKANSKAKK